MVSPRLPRWARRAGLAACALLVLGAELGAPRAQPAPTAAASEAPAVDAGPLTLRTTELCIDQAIAERLAVKRKRRGAVDRLFVKQARHELTAGGGYYSSDLFSSTYILTGSYTYYMTEETGVEFAAAYTKANADIIRALEDRRGQALGDTAGRTVFFESLLMWAPIYGKLRLGGSVLHFDLNAGIGVGVVDSETSRGASGALGLGMKLFFGRALAVRLDARNRTFYQELLDKRFLVNDSAITLGLSLFLPMSN
ncbi:MAG: outer membrane beta-barrel domain-containing protein [Kofleriaceae bacterium]